MALDLSRPAAAPAQRTTRLADLPTRDMNARRSIKVRIPTRLLIKLHAAKLFQDSNISDTVEAALKMYFDRLPHDASGRLARGAAAPPAPSPEPGFVDPTS